MCDLVAHLRVPAKVRDTFCEWLNICHCIGCSEPTSHAETKTANTSVCQTTQLDIGDVWSQQSNTTRIWCQPFDRVDRDTVVPSVRKWCHNHVPGDAEALFEQSILLDSSVWLKPRTLSNRRKLRVINVVMTVARATWGFK